MPAAGLTARSLGPNQENHRTNTKYAKHLLADVLRGRSPILENCLPLAGASYADPAGFNSKPPIQVMDNHLTTI